MNKKIYIALADGRTYSVLAHDVAHNRATHYAERDKDSTYQSEYDFTISDKFELTDWLFNQMDWYEMSPVLEKTEQDPLNQAEILETYVGE